MQIPPSLTDGNYRLRLEGFGSSSPFKMLFAKEAQLIFHPEFLSIIVQTNRKVYRNEMTGKVYYN